MVPSTRPCPNCGEILRAQARFCGTCEQSLPPLAEVEEEQKRGGLGVLPPIPGAEGAAAPSVWAAAQTGAPGVPSLPAGPQSGAPSVPTVPGAAQSGSTVLRGATRVAGQGLRDKLLGTGAGKVLFAVLAVVVLAACGSGGSGASQAAGAHPTSTPTSTANPRGPNGSPPDTASFTIHYTVSGPQKQDLGNPEHLLLVMGGTVCGPHDNGQPFTYPDPYSPGDTDTSTTTCSGSYQGGKLLYTQMVVLFVFMNSTGVTCTITAQSPWMYQFEGTFTSPTSISGTITGGNGAEPETCNGGSTSTLAPGSGTRSWSGTVSATA